MLKVHIKTSDLTSPDLFKLEAFLPHAAEPCGSSPPKEEPLNLFLIQDQKSPLNMICH